MSWVVAMLVLNEPTAAGKDTAWMLGRSWAKRLVSSRRLSEGLNIMAK